MHPVFDVFGKEIPAYGLMIVTGVVCANLIAYVLLRRKGLNIYDLMILEGYAFLSAFAGAKILYLIVSTGEIDWFRMTDPQYAMPYLRGGFVFYGGLLGGLLGGVLAGRLHGIAWRRYLEEVTFLIPLAHAFGRVGCFLAGCCYGCAWNGVLAVRYPAGGIAPHTHTLFPVQAAEALLLAFLLLTGLLLQHVRGMRHPLRLYLAAYAVIRFALEYVRADAARGGFGVLSTSQWVSVAMLCVLTLRAVFPQRQEAVRENAVKNEYEIS